MMHTSNLRSFVLVFLIGCGALSLVVPPTAEAQSTPTLDDEPERVQAYQALIDPEQLAAQLYFFASDRFMGRETGMPGQRLAAEYLAAQYRQMGLAPKGTQETDDPRALERYFQPFPLYGTRTTQATLTAARNDATIATGIYNTEHPVDSNTFLAFGNAPNREGGLVFGGHGIAHHSYDDYAALDEAGLDVTGNWLLMLRSDPVDEAGTHLLTGSSEPSEWTDSIGQKLQRAFSAGTPAGVLIVADIGPMAIDVSERARILAEFNGPGSMSLTDDRSSQQIPPVYMISTDFANQLMADADRSVASVQREISETEAPVVFDVPDVTLTSGLDQEPYTKTSENVLAYIEGTDPNLRDEVIVITSHYDHIGLEPTSPQGNYINNGADDNGSGTVATLALAQAFKQAKSDGYGPRRSILFLNVTAEEKGLLGSAYYADEEPVFPLEQTVANLNLDMIGRVDPSYPELPDSNYVYIIGGDLISDDLDAINRRANERTGINYTLHERYNDPNDPQALYRRSDQWNFGKHNIPFIFYFSGLHDDYHDVGDEAHKVDYQRLAERTRLVFATTWQLANQDARPAVSGEGFN